MADKDLKASIRNLIVDFSTNPVAQNTINLFDTLGYNTERRSHFFAKTYKSFKEEFLHDNDTRQPKFHEHKACVHDWKSIDILFQLTAEEIKSQIEHFDTKQVNDTIIESYLFLSLELTKTEYSRTKLAQITREINKLFLMPVFIIFKHGANITFSIIDRRLNKKDQQKDVLEKITFIKDISIKSPHRAHIEILFDLSISKLKNIHKINNFLDLHKAWQKTLDTKELNKRFYRDLSNWYLWALNIVNFPTNDDLKDKNGLFKKDEKVKEHNAKNLIRLLTRLLFVWFIKEKNLIPEELFNESYIKENLLKDFDPTQKNKDFYNSLDKDSKYYRAILQNLFFATLNQVIDKREFRKEKQHMNVTNLMRYENYFKNAQKFIDLVKKVPFMNGGLFECLDYPDSTLKGKQDGDVIIYEDGFSDRKYNSLYVPDYIFFANEESVDLSQELDDNKQKNVTVNGLFNILKNYKFTIAENTPIEEDIALDPELLGRVFENLLASYNPETKTTARKQTGSFYTPREIVNYMVDESLKAYLQQKLETEANMKAEDAVVGLEFLLGYNEKDHLFDENQTKALIKGINECKIFDPACGSGAFPMGILHKLVHILHKLDPDNKRWKERQIDKAQEIEDSKIRENAILDIERAFTSNELDYGRKLYLIENCIYGVDIQPTAIQISKLRFFISLIIDQKIDKAKENFGIRPLPNLETKFVSANTLIGIEKIRQGDFAGNIFDNQRIKELEKELKNIRHRLFSVKTSTSKKALREKEINIRKEMAGIFEDEGISNETARQLVTWDPYNQNLSSSWFDAELMFGVSDGFDIVIGNPPYVQLQKDSGKLANMYKNCRYKTFQRMGDIYALFYEMGINVLKEKGYLCYITSNKWMRAGYGKSLRNFFLSYNPILLIDCGPNVFENATVDVNVLLIQKMKNAKHLKAITLDKELKEQDFTKFIQDKLVLLNNLTEDSWFIGNEQEQKLKEKIERIGKPLNDWDVEIYRGILTGLNEAFIIDAKTKDMLIAEDPKSAEIIKPILRGRDVKRYGCEFADLYLLVTGYDVDIPKFYPAVFNHLKQFEEKAIKRDDQGKNWWNLRACVYYKEFEKEKIVYSEIVREPQFYFDNGEYFCEATTFLMTGKSIKYLCGMLNSKFVTCVFKNYYAGGGLGEKGYRYKKVSLEQIPIPPITSQNKPNVEKIELLIDQILTFKKQNPNADTKNLEEQIDQLVYKLYELTEEEIAIVENE